MLRPVELRDLRFLRDMLRHAYYWRLEEDRERPVYRYVQNWGRAGDAGVIALAGPAPVLDVAVHGPLAVLVKPPVVRVAQHVPQEPDVPQLDRAQHRYSSCASWIRFPSGS